MSADFLGHNFNTVEQLRLYANRYMIGVILSKTLKWGFNPSESAALPLLFCGVTLRRAAIPYTVFCWG